MTKKEMIKELVLAWVRHTSDESVKMNRFCKANAIENRIDRMWRKSGVEMWYQKLINDEEGIEYIIDFLTRAR